MKMTRRELIVAAGAATVAGASLPAHTLERRYWSAEYWAHKGDAKLYLYRKRLEAPHPGQAPLPVLLLIHGSSLSGRATYDLAVPGREEYSLMNVFAAAGFDTWALDCEGYGKSTRSDGNCDVATGAQDIQAAMAVLERETGLKRYHLFGESSGALRAGVFAMHAPERVNRLVLSAFTYTGKDSPTLAARSKNLDFFRTHNLRKRDADMIHSIFTRDKPGTGDPAAADALAKAELQFGDTVPTGTYLDMTSNLPLVEPARVTSPTLIVRGEYDGIATVDDLLDFFGKLPNANRQFVIVPNAAHNLVSGYNRRLLWQAVQGFLGAPEPLPLQA